jgi:hypothetical protein
VCGPDVTQWFYEDLKKHIEWAKKFQGTGSRIMEFAHQAKNLMAHKWMTFDHGDGECATNDCRATVTLAGVCIRKNVLGNIAFMLIGTMFPPGWPWGTPTEVARKGIEIGGTWPSGAERKDNVAAFGVGTWLAGLWPTITNLQTFTTTMWGLLNNPTVLNTYAGELKKAAKLVLKDLTWIEDSATPGGYDTAKCEKCGKTWSPYFPSSIDMGIEILKEYNKMKDPEQDIEDWRKKKYENYYGSGE